MRNRRFVEVVATISMVAIMGIGNNAKQVSASENCESEIVENIGTRVPAEETGLHVEPELNAIDLSISVEVDAVDVEKLASEAKLADTEAGIYNVKYVATLIESEAGNVDSIDGRVAVALTAFYRVHSETYPDTLSEVVEQPFQYADLVDGYSDKSHVAAIKAISLWSDETSEALLPNDFLYFFGYNKQNWFYRLADDGTVEFYALPGQEITADVWQAYKEIVGYVSNNKYIVVEDVDV